MKRFAVSQLTCAEADAALHEATDHKGDDDGTYSIDNFYFSDTER